MAERMRSLVQGWFFLKMLWGGMPYWKFAANIFLTKLENFVLGYRLSEYHSGFRAYNRKVMQLPLELDSDDFVFDTEIIVQMRLADLKIKEIPIKTKYFSRSVPDQL